MSDLRIRPARASDLPAIGEITLAAYLADGFPGESGYVDKLADAGPRARDAELLVAVDGEDRVLGTVTVARHGTPMAEIGRPDELEFRMLAVHPQARGRGVGEFLVRAIIARARELGLARVVLSSAKVLTNAHRLYERLGFRRTPTRDWDIREGVTLIVFELDLA